MMQFSIILLLLFISASKMNAVKLVVSTYNLWNIMFNWEIRKHRISRMIKESNPDVIAFQEVRSDVEDKNQIIELQKLLPKYKWTFFKSSTRVKKHKHSIHKDYDREGIGFLSKLPIIYAKAEELPYKYGPDINKRLLVHVKILQEDHHVFNIINIHFSYDRQQQCGNAAAVLDYIFRLKLRNVIILGDFNTYNDFESPIDLITLTQKPEQTMTGCNLEQRNIGNRFTRFDDAWQKLYGNKDLGLTFSNMPSPGMQSRPDRILVSSDIEVVGATLSGNGTTYRHQYKSGIGLNRLQTILSHAALSYQGTSGYSCLHDCGPHGSCRCGICVAVGNEKTCNLPYCDECNGEIYRNYILVASIAIFILLHLFYAALSILITGANFRGESVFSILGFNCCLCNPDLFRKPKLLTRRSKFLKIFFKWPFFRLPPCYLLVISCIAFLFLIFYVKSIFASTLKSVYNVLEEEYFPSDHLMITVIIKNSNS